MKAIQVHCFADNGERFIMNRLTTDNMEVGNNHDRYKQLLLKAINMAYIWSTVYPNDKFKAVEL